MLFINPPPSPFEPPSLLYHFVSSPLRFLIQCIYRLFLFFRDSAIPQSDPTSPIRLVCISDTHTKKATIPNGDVLIHAGDLANHGTAAEIQEQVDWIASLPHHHKVLIAGNHDSFFDPRSRHAPDVKSSIDFKGIHYLQHSSLTLSFPESSNRQINFYGAPQIPEIGPQEFAFQYPRQQDTWSDTIPPSTDILITHTPPRHHLDLHGLGCGSLLKEVWRVRPKVHVFGHVHAAYGRESAFWDEGQRAYERVCGREKAGLLTDLFDVFAWLDVVRVAWHGIKGVVWHRIWQGDEKGTLMINVSLTYRSTGELRNPPQIVDI
ncbi:MAG: hypothetical protein Q9201_000620 [Fulgogasparrea decipioides]